MEIRELMSHLSKLLLIAKFNYKLLTEIGLLLHVAINYDS